MASASGWPRFTGAEWGIVTAGCCAAITHFTASAIAGGNPERMQRLPNLAGLKNEAIVPAYSHQVYDHAVRMLGVKLVVVKDKAELEAAFNERTAMCYILAGPGDDGPLGTQGDCRGRAPQKCPRAGGRRGRNPHASNRTFTWRAARRRWPTAAANAFAVRRPPDCCWATRACCRARGSTARRIMLSAAR